MTLSRLLMMHIEQYEYIYDMNHISWEEKMKDGLRLHMRKIGRGEFDNDISKNMKKMI